MTLARRPEAVEPFVRGVAWPAAVGASYPRADLTDTRLPADTFAVATLPVGARLEMVGDASSVDVEYMTGTEDLGYRGAGAGTTFSVWRGTEQVDEAKASVGRGSVRLQFGSGTERAIVYLPEGMKPVVTAVAAVGGSIEPAAHQPRWIAYGDSIVEGWVASGPTRSWPAIAGREHGLDVVNMGYAGSARGEIASAEHIAGIDAQVIALSWGTNCWSRVVHSADMMRATTRAFLRVVRGGHPGVPIVVASPAVRPDAEGVANSLGASLSDLRRAMEDAVLAFDDELVTLVRGYDLLTPDLLADGVHPGDDGHRVLAQTLGGAVADALSSRRASRGGGRRSRGR